MIATTGFTIAPRGPFSLAQARDFLAGFPPASHSWTGGPAHLRLAFPLDRTGEAVGVALHEDGGAIRGEVVGTENVEAAERQVARILSLDHDGAGYLEVGRRDPVVGRLQAAHPGLRPVCFSSPYEAATWAILSNRIQMTQAATIKARLVAALGEAVEVDGEHVMAFPSPARLRELDAFPGIPAEKILRLRGVAEAALAGRLDAERLRAMPMEEALAELRSLRGIGEWSAQLILLRGAGVADGTPLPEPYLLRALARAYRLNEPPDGDAFRHPTELWRPYRTWAAFLMRNA